ncbi:MAG: tyrosine--tRNA ligase [Candidatus Delongbacteria bacterium]|nr:tyrosine--tRNA ligase [Candidatus Delongbacteria bacterium]MCG2760124.1 tyrosine--tRNA ligase [Candidatus Delongbacteria bacterium]
MSELYEELEGRGLIKQTTLEIDKLKSLLNGTPISVYAGFDPTKPSLHVGHLIPIMILAHMQRAGHRPICVVGGATAMIGDPSGRDNMREMLTEEIIQENLRSIKPQLSNFINFRDEKALLVNNYDWLGFENYIDFIRKIGNHFTVNRMLAADCFKIRMEKGLSFLEFNYMILQAYDFYTLFNKYECVLQIGGDDQWSNIIAGVELIRRIDGKKGYGMTNPLLTRCDGKKMGKTEGGAVWLDPDLTSPFEYYQFWRNTTDDDVIKFLKIYTFIPLYEIEKYSSLKGEELNGVKEILAYEATKIVHGKIEADKAKESAENLFKKGSADNASAIKMTKNEVEGHLLIDICVSAGLFESKSEAKRMILQGGLSLNGIKVDDLSKIISSDDFQNGNLILKKGKKIFLNINVS